MKTKVLVTGSEGFLGKAVCRELSTFGYQIVPFDINSGSDIMNRKQVLDALNNSHTCIHLAAVSDLYEADENPSKCHDINVTGTQNVALACFQTKTRLLYASTCCAYGNNNQEISDEDSPVSPTELYAETKLQGEKVIENVGGEYSLLRLATFYGPNMRSSLATSIFLRKILSGQEIEIHGDGKQTRCYTHVDDIASAIRIVLESVNTPKIINISDDTAYSVNDLVKIISKVTGKHPKVKYVNDRAGQIWTSSIKSLRIRHLGWQPKWNLMSGLTDCMNHLKS